MTTGRVGPKSGDGTREGACNLWGLPRQQVGAHDPRNGSVHGLRVQGLDVLQHALEVGESDDPLAAPLVGAHRVDRGVGLGRRLGLRARSGGNSARAESARASSGLGRFLLRHHCAPACRDCKEMIASCVSLYKESRRRPTPTIFARTRGGRIFVAALPHPCATSNTKWCHGKGATKAVPQSDRMCGWCCSGPIIGTIPSGWSLQLQEKTPSST